MPARSAASKGPIENARAFAAEVVAMLRQAQPAEAA